MIIEREIEKWKGFVRALRVDDRVAFEELINSCRGYASAAGAATRPFVIEAMFMSILLSHQKNLMKVENTLEKLKSRLHSES